MSTETTAAVGALLKEYRLAAGITQEVLAERAGISVRSVQAIESGTNKPHPDTARRLADALGLVEDERARLLTQAASAPRHRSPTPPSAIAFTAPGGTGDSAAGTTGSRAASVPRNPYKGLRAFRTEDADDFFGRATLVGELVVAVQSYARPEAARILAVVGPSGAGKSSVVLAGLLPQLRRDTVRGSADWVYLDPLIPGDHPLEALSIAVASALPRSSLTAIRADLDASERGLHLLSGRLASRPESRVLLVIDQAEELFTVAEEEERRQFIDLLTTAVCAPRGQLMAVLVLRADFYDRPMSYSQLGRLVTVQNVAVLPLEPAELRAAIEGPATLPDVGLCFEGSLVSDLLYEVREQSGALPLLQFTLEQLYARRVGRLLTEAAYRALGGVRGALARHAEATYLGLPSDEHRDRARVLFLRLIEPGASAQEMTRRRAALAELELTDPVQTARLRAVAEAFITARLVTAVDSGGATTLEVSHEALIREWTRLGAWLHEAREDVWVQVRLSADAAEWQRRERPVDSLYRGTVLAEAQSWAARNTPSAREEAFLAAAAAEGRRQMEAERERQARELTVAQRAAAANRRAARRLRALAGGLAVFLLAAGGLAALAQANAIQARRAQAQATHQRDTARTAQRLALSRQLAAQALNHLDSQLDLALLLSVQSYRLLGTAEARAGLLPVLEAQPPGLIAFLGGHTLRVNSLAMSPDGRILASGSEDGTIRFWDLRRRRVVGQPLKSADGAIGSVAFSPDGRFLVSADHGGNVQVWDVAGRRPVGATLPGARVGVNAVAFSPDGKVIAAACDDNTIRLWDTVHQRPLAFSPLQGDSLDYTNTPNGGIVTLAFSPNGKLLASGNEDGTLQLWDARTGLPYAPLPGELGILYGHTSFVHSVAFSPDGKLLASASADETIRLWDVVREQQLGAPLITHIDYVHVLAFSSDGTLASGSEDGTIRLWDVRRRRQLGAPLAGHTGGESSLVFSSDGTILASGTGDGPIALWDVRHRQPVVTTLASGVGRVYGMAVSPDGHTLATASDDGTIRLWDLTRERLRRAISTGNTLTSAAFSLDGRMLAVGAAGRGDDVWGVYDVASGRMLYQPPWPQVGVNQVAFSPDGTILALARVDGTIQLWSVARQPHGRWHTLGAPLDGDPNFLAALAFSPDGTLLASGGSDGTIRLWDVVHRRVSGPPLIGHADAVTALAFSPSGTLLASASDDQTIRLWDVRRHKPFGAPLIGHTEPPDAVAFSPDGTLLASGSVDVTVRLWDAVGGQPLGGALTGFGETVSNVAFTPDGTRLIATGFDGIIRIWNVDLHGWPNRACQIANRNLTHQEWRQYMGDLPYQKTCPGLPASS